MYGAAMPDQDRRPPPASDSTASPAAGQQPAKGGAAPPAAPDEVGGPKGPEPTRYGDWQIKGRVSDF